MKLQSLVFIFFCCVYYVFGETSFIPKGQRAEIFELTDNEVPVFRITLSDDEYDLLKRKASLMDTDYFQNVNGFIKETIELINNQNFNEIFPGYNFNEILPELPMNEYGYPNIDYEKFYIDINNLHYIDFAYIKRSFYNIFKRNSYLDLIKVFQTLNNLDVSSEVDETFIGLIHEFGTEDEKKFEIPDGIREKFPSSSKMYDYFGFNYTIYDDSFDDDTNNYDLPSSDLNYESPSSGLNYDNYDPNSGLNYDPNSDLSYDPNSGLNNDNYDPNTNLNYDPNTGLNYDPNTSLNYDPNTGLNYDPNTGSNYNNYDPNAGLNYNNYDPNAGLNYDNYNQNSDSNYDPNSGLNYDQNSSFNYDQNSNFNYDPITGWYYDPNSGWYYDPNSGWYYDSNSGLYYDINSGLYYDPNTGLNSDSQFSKRDSSSSSSSYNFIKSLSEYLNSKKNNDNLVNKDDLISMRFNEFNSKDFKEYFNLYDFDKTVDNNSLFNEEKTDFKTKNATLIVEINNEKKSFNEITFSLSGCYSRNFAKPGYNLKIRGDDELFGRRQFKLRGDASEPSYMRSKLVSDIRNRLEMPSLSANYATLYINDEYLGLYILTDAYKESWIEYVYGEKDTQSLYKCNYGFLDFKYRSFFENENKEATNRKEFYEFLAEMTKANSLTDVESIFDTEQFYREIAIDLLVSSWDHTFHNYYVYKNKENNKWIYLSHDFDLDMGITKGASMKLQELYYSDTIFKFISKDDTRFREIIKEIVSKVFNPATLYPHIDEIKTFIRPYVELEKTPDEYGQYPGRLNKFSSDFYSFEQWEDSIEFKNFSSGEFNFIYALKKFILLRYRVICHEYKLECDPIYLDRNYGKNLNITNDLIMDELNDKKEQIDIEV